MEINLFGLKEFGGKGERISKDGLGDREMGRTLKCGMRNSEFGMQNPKRLMEEILKFRILEKKGHKEPGWKLSRL